MSDLKLGFLVACSFEEGKAIRGAILITDDQTKPIEFRVTSPIRPTSFQKTLYGKILLEHILVDLVTLPLLDSIKEKPDILIVRDTTFLNANGKQDKMIVRIFKEDENRSNSKIEPEQLSSKDGSFEPVHLETSENVKAKLNEVRAKLSDVFANRNLLEPFERVTMACKQVHSKGVGENNA